MTLIKFAFILVLAAGATLALANPEIQAEARKRHPDQEFKCGTCHEELPTRVNGYKLRLTEEGERWRAPEDPQTCSWCTIL